MLFGKWRISRLPPSPCYSQEVARQLASAEAAANGKAAEVSVASWLEGRAQRHARIDVEILESVHSFGIFNLVEKLGHAQESSENALIHRAM